MDIAMTEASLYKSIVIAFLCSFLFQRICAKPAKLTVSMSDRHPDPVAEKIKHIKDVYDRQQESEMDNQRRKINTEETNQVKWKLGEKDRLTVIALWKAIHKASLSRPFEGGSRELKFDIIPLLSAANSDIHFPNDRIAMLPSMMYPVINYHDKIDITTSTVATTVATTKDNKAGHVEKRGRKQHVLFRPLRPYSNFKFNFGKITIDPIYYFIGLGK